METVLAGRLRLTKKLRRLDFVSVDYKLLHLSI